MIFSTQCWVSSTSFLGLHTCFQRKNSFPGTLSSFSEHPPLFSQHVFSNTINFVRLNVKRRTPSPQVCFSVLKGKDVFQQNSLIFGEAQLNRTYFPALLHSDESLKHTFHFPACVSKHWEPGSPADHRKTPFTQRCLSVLIVLHARISLVCTLVFQRTNLHPGYLCWIVPSPQCFSTD